MPSKQFFTTLLIVLVLIAFALFFYQSSKINTPMPGTPATTTEPVVTDVQPQQITVKGTYTECLPRHDNFSSPECFVGIKAEDNSYYILDFNLMSQTKPTFKNGEVFTASGIFTPIEMLSSDRYQGSIAKGIFSITTLEKEQTPVVSKPTPTPTTPKPVQGKCYIGGCSAQICSDQPDMASTCEYREQYACYKQNSTCERQSNGACGWTQTPALKACILRTN